MRGKPTRKTHHVRPRTIRPRVAEGHQQADVSVVQGSATKRKCVLVVEDNATIGGLLVALLREEGYRALRAWDGREAIKMARDRPPDLIVLDLSLPYRDGVEVLREIRGNSETTDAPIVVVSGNALQLTQDDRALVSETVTKPFDIDRLMNVLRRLLGDEEVAVPERGYDKTDSHLNSW
jgi:DNA-binding response OmpR family regulator